ncbi:alanine racemase [Lactovum odontotermitis]
MIPAPHRHTPAKINLAAIRQNLMKIRTHIGTNGHGKVPEIWPAVKANAYGHGAVKVSQAIEDLVGGFCVSNLDEAIELRDSGLAEKPILILSGIVPEDAHIAHELNLTLAAPSLEWLELVVKSAVQDLAGLKLHIAVDSGMGRIGVRDFNEANAMIDLMDRHGILFDGVFTHFATADEAETEKYEQQSATFAAFLSNLSRQPRYVHSTNSAAGIWHSEQVQDIERLGLALYGLNPSGRALSLPADVELVAALSLQSELTHVKEIQSGDTVGYGATFTASEPTFIGTLPIGYADGWARDLQGFHVLVNGKFCEIVGRISMDQMTIKLDQRYPLATKVTLIGCDGGEEITVDDIAAYRGTINYEVLTSLSDRIYREYF